MFFMDEYFMRKKVLGRHVISLYTKEIFDSACAITKFRKKNTLHNMREREEKKRKRERKETFLMRNKMEKITYVGLTTIRLIYLPRVYAVYIDVVLLLT